MILYIVRVPCVSKRSGFIHCPRCSLYFRHAVVLYAVHVPCVAATLANLFVVIVLGASFQPSTIGTWFSLHGLAVAMVILILEPFKCLWEVDFGWEQPTK